MSNQTTLRAAWTALLVVLGVVAAVQFARYGGYYYDDAYISLRYSRRFLAGQGLTWTQGEVVEGYSNFLWVVLCAALRGVGIPWVTTTHVLGGLGLVAVVVAAATDPREPLRPNLARWAYGGVTTLLTGAIVIWAAGGLEQTFLAGLVTLGLIAVLRALEVPGGRERWIAAALFAAGALTRADAAGLWLATLAGIGVVYVFFPDRRPAALALWPLLVVPAIAVAGHEAFRLAYYGDWIPNTARAKVALTEARVWNGLRYVREGSAHHAVLVGGALVAVTLKRTPRTIVPFVASGLWLGYVAFVGGDFMAGWRFLVPTLGWLGWLLGEAAVTVPARLAGALVVPVWLFHGAASNTGRLIDKAFHRDGWEAGPPIAVALRRGFRRFDPLLAVDAAGALPFYTRMRSLDLLGLNDRWLATHPPPRFGGTALGHDLGNPDYVWSRKPDLMLFNGTNGTKRPRYVSARGVVARPDFDDVYQYVNLRVQVHGDWWPVHLFVRREDGPLAVQRGDDTIEIPGWFFARETGSKAYLDGRNVITRVWPEGPGELFGLRVPPGHWTFEAEGDYVHAFRCDGTTVDRLVARPDDGDVIELAEPTPLDVLVRSRGRAHLARASLVRTDRAPTVRCAEGPLRRSSDELGPVAEAGTNQRVRDMVTFGRQGLSIPLDPKLRRAPTLEAGLANGVAYVLEWHRGDAVVGREELRPVPLQRHERGHISLHRVDVPVGEPDTLSITVRRGLGVISHLRIAPEVSP